MEAVEQNDVDAEVAVDNILMELVNVLPGVDPEYLQQKATVFVARPEAMNEWVLGVLEDNCAGLPTRQDYEDRVRVCNH